MEAESSIGEYNYGTSRSNFTKKINNANFPDCSYGESDDSVGSIRITKQSAKLMASTYFTNSINHNKHVFF